MIIEYCDKCRKEITDKSSSGKEVLEVAIADGYHRKIAKIVLCRECFDNLEILEKVKDVSYSPEKKEPETVDRFLELFKELVTECVEEME